MVEQKNLWGDWEPVVIEDQDVKDFDEPIKGKYEAEIESLEYKDITSKTTGDQFEVISLKMKIVRDVEGDVSLMRKMDKSYFLGESKYSDDPILGYKRLLNDLASAGLYEDWMKNDNIRGTIEKISTAVIGKKVFLNAFPKKDKQQVRIVKPKDAVAVKEVKSKFAV